MKRGIMLTLAGVAMLAAAMAGCSSHGTVGAAGQQVSTSGHAKVVVDGQDQNVTGSVTCQKATGELQIGIGAPGSPGTIAVQATDADPPVIHQIALGTVNGVTYQQGSPGASAQATKNGNGYKFTGTATGMDKSNPMAGLVSKPFEIEVTCP